MLTRVGDLGRHHQATGNLLAAQARVRADEQAVASGKAAASFDQVADRTGSLLRAEGAVELRDAFLRQNGRLLHKLTAADAALGNLVDIADRARTAVIQRLDGATGTAVRLDAEMSVMLDQAVQQLNAAHDGRYLFGGSVTDRPAVVLPTAPVLNADPSLFFQGDFVRDSARIDVGQEVKYGIVAGDPPFATLIAALGNAAQAHSSDDLPKLRSSLEDVGMALDQLIEQRNSLGVTMKQIEDVNDHHQVTLSYIESNLTEIVNVDIADVVTRLSHDKALLEASYLITGQINRLSLLDYIR